MIKISDLVTPERVVRLDVKTKEEALSKMVDVISTAPEVRDRDELYRAIIERERIMSTGIGLGIAVPHAKIGSVSDFVIAIGICPEGIDFDSLDGRPVKIIVMIAGPEGRQKLYLRILARITLFLRNRRNRDAMLKTEDPTEVIELLRAASVPMVVESEE